MIQVNWAEVPPLYPKNINRQFLIRVSRLALVDINNHRRVLVMIGDGDNITWEHLLGSATAHTFITEGLTFGNSFSGFSVSLVN